MVSSVKCPDSDMESYLYGVAALVWITVLFSWELNSRHCNSSHINPLHKMISATLLLKFLLTLFSFMARVSCDSKTFSEYWKLAEGCTFCLFNTFLFVTFLLISKGFCFTREYFERDEINIIAITTGVVYIVFSIYLMQKGWFIVMILVTVVILWYRTNASCKKTMRMLRVKIQQLQIHNLINSLPAAEKKLSMIEFFFNIFQCFVVFYVFRCLWECYMKINEEYSQFVLFLGVRELDDFFGLVGVCFVFWPKFNGQFFDLEFEADVNLVPARIMVCDGRGRDELEDGEQVFVVKQPYGEAGDYGGYLVALPLSLKYHQEFQSELREPLMGG